MACILLLVDILVVSLDCIKGFWIHGCLQHTICGLLGSVANARLSVEGDVLAIRRRELKPIVGRTIAVTVAISIGVLSIKVEYDILLDGEIIETTSSRPK